MQVPRKPQHVSAFSSTAGEAGAVLPAACWGCGKIEFCTLLFPILQEHLMGECYQLLRSDGYS